MSDQNPATPEPAPGEPQPEGTAAELAGATEAPMDAAAAAPLPPVEPPVEPPAEPPVAPPITPPAAAPAPPPQWPSAGTTPPAPPAPPGYPPSYQPGYQAAYPPAPETSSNAIIALILAIVSWAMCPIIPAIVALVLAGNAAKEINASGGRIGGSGLVTAARIVSWANIGVWAAALVVGAFFFVLVAVAGGFSTN